MPKTYEPIPAAVRELLQTVLTTHQPTLAGEGVTIDALFVLNETKDGEVIPALKSRGYPAAATIQVTSLADRARGLADAKLTICQHAWGRLPEASRAALIDHELEHLTLVIEDDGTVKRDDVGRPVLKTQCHDFEITGFTAVVQRHGESSVEARALVQFKNEQLPLFPAGSM